MEKIKVLHQDREEIDKQIKARKNDQGSFDIEMLLVGYGKTKKVSVMPKPTLAPVKKIAATQMGIPQLQKGKVL